MLAFEVVPFTILLLFIPLAPNGTSKASRNPLFANTNRTGAFSVWIG